MKIINFINTLKEKYTQISPPVLIKKKNGLEFYQFNGKNTRTYHYLVVTNKKKEIIQHKIIAKNKIKSEIEKILEQNFWKNIKIKRLQKKAPTHKKEKLFHDEKLIKDLVMVYIAYAYIDEELKSQGFIEFDKNYNAHLTKKAKENEDYFYIKQFYKIQQMLFNALHFQHGITYESVKGQIIVNRANTEIKKAFGNNHDIIALYFGFVTLFKYKYEVKYKKVFINVDMEVINEVINTLNDKYYKKDDELSPALDNSEDIVDRLFESLYKNESWYNYN
jgi:hypothetical protein